MKLGISLFSKIVSRLTPKPYGYYPVNLHIKALPFLEHLKTNDLNSALEIFQGESEQTRPYLIEALSDIVTEDDFYEPWFDNSNGPEEICLLRGALLTVRAWHYRGWGRGEEVGEKRGNRMHQTLEAAQRSLLPLVDSPLYGQDAAAIMIRVSMGLESSLENTKLYLDRLREFKNPHLFGEHNFLVASCEKWSGSHSEMFDFARTTVYSHKRFPEIGGLVALAHFERQLYFDSFDEDTLGGEAYRNDENVFNEVMAYSEILLESPDTKSLHYSFAHNAFAFFFCDRNMFDLAKPHFKAIGNRVTRMPWAFYDTAYLNQAYNISLL